MSWALAQSDAPALPANRPTPGSRTIFQVSSTSIAECGGTGVDTAVFRESARLDHHGPDLRTPCLGHTLVELTPADPSCP